MDVLNILRADDSEYVFNALKIENHTSESASRLRFWYSHCRANFDKLEGHIFEFGVYQGASLLSMALLLKRLGSNKRVYGFDSFAGFPSYHELDRLENFEKFKGAIFDNDHVAKVDRLKKIRSSLDDKTVNVSNISGAGAFESTSYESLSRKIAKLELDNISLIRGDFLETIPSFFSSYQGKVFSANIDCDLYVGYKTALSSIWDRLVGPGGYIHLDEYYSLKFPGARIACDEFFKDKQVKPNKQPVRSSEFERWFVQK